MESCKEKSTHEIRHLRCSLAFVARRHDLRWAVRAAGWSAGLDRHRQHEPLDRRVGQRLSESMRGPENIANPSLGLASFGDPNNALGPADGNTLHVVSLGDGGQITLTFDHPITNGPGFDFAVFENGFSDTFLELAFVEVSSDGTDFVRFPSISLTQTTTQVGGSGALDTTNIYDLAGKYRVGFGTPFDLSEVAGVNPLVDVNEIRYVRVIDVVGSINPQFGTRDSQGNLINDPYPTPTSTGGFDLNGVGVMNMVPEPSTMALAACGAAVVALAARRRRR